MDPAFMAAQAQFALGMPRPSPRGPRRPLAQLRDAPRPRAARTPRPLARGCRRAGRAHADRRDGGVRRRAGERGAGRARGDRDAAGRVKFVALRDYGAC